MTYGVTPRGAALGGTADIRLTSLRLISKELNFDNGHNDVGGREPWKERGGERK